MLCSLCHRLIFCLAKKMKFKKKKHSPWIESHPWKTCISSVKSIYSEVKTSFTAVLAWPPPFPVSDAQPGLALSLAFWSLLTCFLNIDIFFSCCAKRLKSCMFLLQKQSALQSTWMLTPNTYHPDSDITKENFWNVFVCFPFHLSSCLPSCFSFVLMRLNTNSRYEIILLLTIALCISL